MVGGGGVGKSVLNAYLPGSVPAEPPAITGTSSGHLSPPCMLPQLNGEDSICGHFQKCETGWDDPPSLFHTDFLGQEAILPQEETQQNLQP